MVKTPAKFITIEGVEGVGKSTNIDFLKSLLDEKSIDYVITREPGGTLTAEKIRELLLAVDNEPLCETAELLLVFAARAQHIAQLIRPALSAGKWVICDRFTDATFAYQGAGRGLDLAAISALQSLVQQELRPDLTLILDLDPVIGLDRANQRGDLDRFEMEEIEFFKRVRQAYLEIAGKEPERCVIIDAAQPLEKVKVDLLQAVCEKLGI